MRAQQRSMHAAAVIDPELARDHREPTWTIERPRFAQGLEFRNTPCIDIKHPRRIQIWSTAWAESRFIAEREAVEERVRLERNGAIDFGEPLGPRVRMG